MSTSEQAPFGKNPGETELATAYSQKFWDAGNLIVTMMFVLAFTVYLALVQYPEARTLVAKFYCALLLLALVGNGGLGFVLWRLYLRERQVIRLVTSNETFLKAILASFWMRLAVFAFNVLLYLGVITFVWCRSGGP